MKDLSVIKSIEDKLTDYLNIIRKKKQCETCSLLITFCICKQLLALRDHHSYTSILSRDPKQLDLNTNVHIVEENKYDRKYQNGTSYDNHPFQSIHIFILMHLKERFKASNTAKIIHAICNESNSAKNHDGTRCLQDRSVPKVSSEIVIYGIPTHVEKMMKKLELGRTDTRCFQTVLFPSSDSQTLNKLLLEHSHYEYFQKCHIVIVDGTWRQARRMQKILPEWLPRIRLSELLVSSFHIRNQSQLGRISTSESLGIFFKEMALCMQNQTNSDRPNTTLCEHQQQIYSTDGIQSCFFNNLTNKLNGGLQILVEHVLTQSNKLCYRKTIETRNANCALPPIQHVNTL